MGTILRTAEALGVLHIALVGACCDICSPKVLRGSMGAVLRLGFEQYESALQCAAALNERGLRSLAAVPDSAAAPITSIPFEAGRWAVWIGNEGNGLTPVSYTHLDVYKRQCMLYSFWLGEQVLPETTEL